MKRYQIENKKQKLFKNVNCRIKIIPEINNSLNILS